MPEAGLASVRDPQVPLLPRVLVDAPAAVLFVDLTQGTVTYANDLAQQLAPGLALPADLAAWSVAAGLHDAGGQPLEQTANPLARVAAGQPVSGEAVSAARGNDATRQREPLWVIGLPLDGAPGPLGSQALVVFLPVSNPHAVARMRGEAGELRSRAVIASQLSFTISDPAQPDNPLVYVNPAFEVTTGYRSEEVLGRNCRLLQGADTDPAAVGRLRDAVREGRSVSETLLNYRKDGSAFWNSVAVNPVFDAEGRLTHFVGVQSDVTLKVDRDRERDEAYAVADRALAAERAARAGAEKAQQHLKLLSEASRLASLDMASSLKELCEIAVPTLADWVAITVLRPDGSVDTVEALHRDGHEDLIEQYKQRQPSLLRADSAVRRVLASREPELVREPGEDYVTTLVAPGETELNDTVRRLGLTSALVVPLIARHRVLGAMALIQGESGRGFDDADARVAEDLGRRAAQALDNARLYTAEHQTALTLQSSLLPPVAQVDGLDLGYAYLPGSLEAEVGGDWYDVLPLPDGAIGLAIGDVMGHDIAAAAAMGQLRSVLRSYAWEGDPPAQVLERLDRLVIGLQMAQLATCVYARLQDAGPQGYRLTYANAGHHAPLVRLPDGTVAALDEGRSIVIGVAADQQRPQAQVMLPHGTLLLLFTDGLVEDHGRHFEEGVQQLRDYLAALPADAGAQSVTDNLSALVRSRGQDDDVCLLAVRLPPR